MKLINQIFAINDISIIQMKESDLDTYYKLGFENLDKEVMYYTGIRDKPTKDEVTKYFNKIIPMEDRYDFFIMQNNVPIGEIVISNIDNDNSKCSMRLAIFKNNDFNKGYGSTAIILVQVFVFDVIGMNRIELEVFSYNERGINTYIKTGFKEEGRLREAKTVENKYTDIVIMGMLKREYDIRK